MCIIHTCIYLHFYFYILKTDSSLIPLIPDQHHSIQYNFSLFIFAIPFSDSRNLVVCVYFSILFLCNHVPRTCLPFLIGSDILFGCHPFPILASSPCAALHHWTGALLTHLGLKNSLWANFPPHIDSLLISFGLWFSTLGLCPNSHHM